MSWSLLGVALFFVAARFISRAPILKGSGYWWDDWTILLTAALAIPLAAILDVMLQSGLGRDIWTLDPDQITRVVYFLWIEQYIYITIVSATKLSILFLFLRMWPKSTGPETRVFRICCMLLLVLVGANNLAFFIALSVECLPTSYIWTRWTGETTGHCIALDVFIYSPAGINIAFDILVAVLPLRRLLKLEISPRRKLAICVTFSIGLFVTICSIVRLQYLKTFSDTQNPTWNYNEMYVSVEHASTVDTPTLTWTDVLSAVWSSVECNLSIVCACMPAMAGLLQRIWSHTLGSTSPSYPTSTSHASRTTDRSHCQAYRLGDDDDDENFPRWNHSAPLTEEEFGGLDEGQKRASERESQLYHMKAFAND